MNDVGNGSYYERNIHLISFLLYSESLRLKGYSWSYIRLLSFLTSIFRKSVVVLLCEGVFISII